MKTVSIKTKTAIGIDALERDWTFAASKPDMAMRLRRLIAVKGIVKAPASLAIMPFAVAPRWIVYFVYLPDGALTDAHRFTLARLREGTAKVAVICAAATVGDVPAELRLMADALYWKALPGFDFSAYALAVREIVAHSPGADVLVLNDSVFGPFVPADSLWPQMAWDLTGFTASAAVQNHIQSYAFHIKALDRRKAQALRTIFPARFAFGDYRGAVFLQETRFATVAAKAMSVGALWYADGSRSDDPSLFAALALLEAGFPFLKRGLLGKHGAIYERAALLEVLADRDHPVDDLQR